MIPPAHANLLSGRALRLVCGGVEDGCKLLDLRKSQGRLRESDSGSGGEHDGGDEESGRLDSRKANAVRKA